MFRWLDKGLHYPIVDLPCGRKYNAIKNGCSSLTTIKFLGLGTHFKLHLPKFEKIGITQSNDSS